MVTINALLRHVGPVLLFVVLLPTKKLFSETKRYYSLMLYTVHLQATERKPPSSLPGARNPNRLTLISGVFGRLGVDMYRLLTDERERKPLKDVDHKKKAGKEFKRRREFLFLYSKALTFKNELVR